MELELFSTRLFMREHNAICDHLHAAHPDHEDDELFDKARMIVAALIAKIHTVEWTPAILGTDGARHHEDQLVRAAGRGVPPGSASG